MMKIVHWMDIARSFLSLTNYSIIVLPEHQAPQGNLLMGIWILNKVTV
ncbi:hypothetical protein [Niallia oryzisoli]